MSRFFDELRRRRVAKASAIYAVVAWAVIEAASVILPALNLPDWTVTFVVVLALLGFPVVLVFSWIFDFTGDGVVRTPAANGSAAGGVPAQGRVIDFVVIAVLLGVIGWLGWERAFDDRPADPATTFDSIAVLPFINMSGDADNEYFSDGLAEELLNALVGVQGLRVAARTSSFQYKGRNLDVREIGKALGVDTVLEGSVRKSGDRIRVTAQLIRATDGFHLWSQTYDRDLEDVFAVQDEITLAIVDALELQLGTSARARQSARHTDSIEAYEAYLRGRFEMHKRTADSLVSATEDFRRAIELDRNYAAAHSGLADTWVLRSSYGGVDGQEALRQAEPLARRAVELDPNLAEAQASMGFVLAQKAEFADTAIEHYRKAIELNPSYSPAYHWLGLALQQQARFSEAAEVMRKAIAIDPRYATGKRALLSALRNIDANDEADALARRLAVEHPDDPLVFYGLGGDAQRMNRPVDALRHYAHALELDPTNITVRISVAYLLLQLGAVDRADEQVAIVRRLQPAHSGLDSWALDRALFTGDLTAYEREATEFLETIPAGLQRNAFACNMYQNLRAMEKTLEWCQAALKEAGWQPGGAVPPGWINAGAAVMLAARITDDQTLVAKLQPAVNQELQRMLSAGLSEGGLRWAIELFDIHAGIDKRDEFFTAFAEEVARGNWSPTVLRQVPLFDPVREDPRFEQMVAEVEARLDAAREAAAAVSIPAV